jgi:prepilin-type N-terminal cleavage/methylation domain-containing protein
LYIKEIAMKARAGFTLIEIMIVVTIIAIIAAVVIPAYVGYINKSKASVCLGNLRELRVAKVHWSMDNSNNGKDSPMMSDLVPDYLKKTPVCASGGTYTIGDLATDPVCSIESHNKN